MALVANVKRQNIPQGMQIDLMHFHGLYALDMSGCSQLTITGSAFVNLRGISQSNVTDYCAAAVKECRLLPFLHYNMYLNIYIYLNTFALSLARLSR